MPKPLKHPPNFYQWLYFYRLSDGAAGEVAAFAHRDPCWPKRARTLMLIIDHLAKHRQRGEKAPNELTLREVHSAFRGFLRSGAPLQSRQGAETPRKPGRHVLKYVSLSKGTMEKLQALQDAQSRPDKILATQSGVIDAAIGHYFTAIYGDAHGENGRATPEGNRRARKTVRSAPASKHARAH